MKHFYYIHSLYAVKFNADLEYFLVFTAVERKDTVSRYLAERFGKILIHSVNSEVSLLLSFFGRFCRTRRDLALHKANVSEALAKLCVVRDHFGNYVGCSRECFLDVVYSKLFVYIFCRHFLG